jgi:hypothetical protein
LLVRLFEEARRLGKLNPEVDPGALGKLVMSTVEGAILICKASKDGASLKTTTETLKWLIGCLGHEEEVPANPDAPTRR